MNRLQFHEPALLEHVPQAPLPAPAPGAFGLCPGCLVQHLSPEQLAWQQSLYRAALEKAQETLRPSIVERDLLAVEN